MRDITLGITFYHKFTTRAFATGIPGTLGGTPVVSAYEDANVTQITAGITLTVDFDSVTGLNHLAIVATSGNGFENGKSYFLVITTGTVDSVSVVGEVVGEFTVGQSAAAVDLANGTDGLGAIKGDTSAVLVDTADMQPLIEKMAYVGPRGLGVWIDDGAANTNTVLGTDGTPDNPISTIAAATTVATALGSQRFYLVNDTEITLAQTYEGYEFIGIGMMNKVTLGSQDVDNSEFINVILTGTQGGTQFLMAEKCQLEALLSLEIVARHCELTGDMTLRVATNQTLNDCRSGVPGGGTPELSFPGAGGATTVNFRAYSGGLQVNGARLNDIMSYEADGQLIIDATCTSLEVHIRGMVSPITDNGTTSIITQTGAIENIATKDQLGQIQVTGTAVHLPADSYTLTTGTQSSGTVSDTAALDGTNHEHTDVAGAMDLYYEFLIGAGIPASVTLEGYLNGNNDDLEVFGYDWVASAWVRIGTLEGKAASSNDIHVFTLFVNMVGSGADEGKVRVRFTDGAFTLTTATLAIDQIFLSFSLGGAAGYELGAIWIDTNASNTNTVPGIDGTSRNPVSTMAAANTLAASLNLHRYIVAPGSSITFAASQDDDIFEGHDWTLALGGQSISGTYISGATVSGTGTGANKPTFEKCDIGNVTLVPVHCENCGFTGTFTMSGAGDYLFDDCHSNVASNGEAILDYGAAVGNTSVHITGWGGGLDIRNMGQTGTDELHITGQGDLILNANCVGGTLDLHGLWDITDNSATVTITETSAYNAGNVNAEVVDVLKTDTVTLPGQTAPPLAPTFEEMVSWLYKVLRNRSDQTSTLWQLYADNETTVDAKATVSDDATTAIVQEIVTGP